MGIAALSSATAQLNARDRFLGWESETFLERCLTEPPGRTADWIQANKHGKTNVLKMLKTMESNGYTIKDVIAELERQLQ